MKDEERIAHFLYEIGSLRRIPRSHRQTLMVDDKWLATLQGSIVAEIERVTQQLASRVKTLEARYADPLPALMKNVDSLSAKVDAHLKKMGLQW